MFLDDRMEALFSDDVANLRRVEAAEVSHRRVRCDVFQETVAISFQQRNVPIKLDCEPGDSLLAGSGLMAEKTSRSSSGCAAMARNQGAWYWMGCVVTMARRCGPQRDAGRKTAGDQQRLPGLRLE